MQKKRTLGPFTSSLAKDGKILYWNTTSCQGELLGKSKRVGTCFQVKAKMEDMYQFNQIPSDTQIRKYLRRIVFGKNIYCPVCKSRNIYASQDRYRCRICRHRFSLLSQTWLSNLKLPLQQFWLVLWCWTTQIPVRQSHKSNQTVRDDD